MFGHLNECEHQPRKVKNCEDHDQGHHGLGQLHLLAPGAARPQELTRLSHLGQDLETILFILQHRLDKLNPFNP